MKGDVAGKKVDVFLEKTREENGKGRGENSFGLKVKLISL